MEPKPVPRKLIEQGIGIPCSFDPPDDEATGGLTGGPRDDVVVLPGLILEDARAKLSLLTGEPQRSVNHRLVTWWQPDEVERTKIAKGAPIRLTILGFTHINPMEIDVGYDLEGILFSEGGTN